MAEPELEPALTDSKVHAPFDMLPWLVKLEFIQHPEIKHCSFLLLNFTLHLKFYTDGFWINNLLPFFFLVDHFENTIFSFIFSLETT